MVSRQHRHLYRLASVLVAAVVAAVVAATAAAAVAAAALDLAAASSRDNRGLHMQAGVDLQWANNQQLLRQPRQLLRR
jgi:hypothetical protein